MRLRKFFLTTLFAVIFVTQGGFLGLSLGKLDEPQSIIVYSFHLSFALYLLLLSIRSVRQEYIRHAMSIVHLSVLSTVAVFLLGITDILPSTPILMARLTADTIPSPRVLLLRYAVLLLYSVAWVVAVTTPRGPAYHYPSDRIYSTKTLMAVHSKRKDNVSGMIGASVWSIMLFSYATKVVMLGYSSESLEIGDLPVVPGDMRATYIFATMRAAMRRWTLGIHTWKPPPGSGWEIGYRLIRVNMGALSLMCVLTSMYATLLYVPPYFLQHIVGYLEADPSRSSPGWGWVFCLGMFLSNVIVQLSKFIVASSVNRTRCLSPTTSRWPVVVLDFAKTPSPSPCSTQLGTVREDVGAQGCCLLIRTIRLRGRQRSHYERKRRREQEERQRQRVFEQSASHDTHDDRCGPCSRLRVAALYPHRLSYRIRRRHHLPIPSPGRIVLLRTWCNVSVPATQPFCE